MANYKEPWNKGKGQTLEQRKVKQAEYYLKNKERILSKVKAHAEVNKDKILMYMKWYAIKKKYRLTKEKYEQMLQDQTGRCKICTKIKPLVIDHCHTSGKVRGLLCGRCNIIMGVIDNQELMSAALEYKRESK